MLAQLAIYESIKIDLPGEYQDVIRACLSAHVAIPPEVYTYVSTTYGIQGGDIDFTRGIGWRRMQPDHDSVTQVTDGSLRVRLAMTDPATRKVIETKVVKVVIE